jgi:putative transposase
MPRHSRFRVAGVPLHVRQRGNNKAACFFEPEHREVFLGMLGELAREHECSVHAYVLMTNHIHLLLTPATADSASLMMKHLGQRYTQYINRTRSRIGSLWEGRFRSNIVDSEMYVMTCYRYVELNPVRAGMVQRPEQYPWSSFRSNALGEPSLIVNPHVVYQHLGRTADERRSAYRELFNRDLDPFELKRIREAISAGAVLGSKEFAEKMARTLGRRVEIGQPGRPRKVQNDEGQLRLLE